jgi:hypothetical protein
MKSGTITAICTLLFAGAVPGCAPAAPAVRRAAPVEEVELSTILSNPKRFHLSRVRVNGICRIEFEGNALYTDRDAYDTRRSSRAVWLDVGWPVKQSIQELDGQPAVVEGIFDETNKGHWGAYAGSFTEIKDLRTP